MSNSDDFLADRLSEPQVRAAYDDAGDRHAVLDELLSRRIELGLTQAEVARRMGVSQPTISGFETEHSDPRVSTLHRYARAVDSVVTIRLSPNLEVGT